MSSPAVVDVRFFWAAGDGRADDTRAIQAAIDRAGGQGGGVVWLPQGTYRVSRQGAIGGGVAGDFCLEMRSGVTLQGTGPASRILATESQVTVILARGTAETSRVSDVRVAQLRISGADRGDGGPGGYGRGIFFWRADRGTVEDCELDGSRLGFQSDRLSTDRVPNRGIALRNCRVHHVVGSHVGNGTGAFAAGTEGLEINGCRFHDIPEHCVYLGQDVHDFRVVHNDCRSSNGSPPGSGTPAGFGVQVYSGTSGRPVSDGVIAGNTVVGGSQGIYLQSQPQGRDVARIVISGNSIRGTSLHGIHCIDAAECVIAQNVIQGSGDRGAGISIERGRGVVASGNVCLGNRGGGVVVSDSQDCAAVGNIALGREGDPVELDRRSARCEVKGNVAMPLDTSVR